MGRCVAECDRLGKDEGEYVAVWQKGLAEGLKVCGSAGQSMGEWDGVW